MPRRYFLLMLEWEVGKATALQSALQHLLVELHGSTTLKSTIYPILKANQLQTHLMQ
jgi:hypothetical protein